MIGNKLLIIDDDQQLLDTLSLILKYEFEKISTVKNPNLVPEIIKKERFDVILLDMNFSAGKISGNEGLFWLRKIKEIDQEATVVMISAYATIDLAIEIMKEGAVDFILKPWENQKLIATIKSACKLSKTKEELAKSKALNTSINNNLENELSLMESSSPKMQKVLDTIKIVAPTEANILILGENGTGKEIIAREIHRNSLRKNKYLVQVDLGSISENLFESELFGHIKGAFTGAVANKLGRFEIANKSTLFLDEIGNISVTNQGKLLSVIQNKEFYPVGSERIVESNVRIICATNKNLELLVEENNFREDLLYRINTIQIEIPPLRYRKEDIKKLAVFFLNRFNDKYSKHCQLQKSTIKYIESYDWPGNIRELKHTIERAVILANKDNIAIDQVGFVKQHGTKMKAEPKTWNEIERFYLRKTFNKYHGNISEIARELNLSRPSIYRKIKKYGL